MKGMMDVSDVGIRAAESVMMKNHLNNLPTCSKCGKEGCTVSATATCEWCGMNTVPLYLVDDEYLCEYC